MSRFEAWGFAAGAVFALFDAAVDPALEPDFEVAPFDAAVDPVLEPDFEVAPFDAAVDPALEVAPLDAAVDPALEPDFEVELAAGVVFDVFGLGSVFAVDERPKRLKTLAPLAPKSSKTDFPFDFIGVSLSSCA